MDQADTVKMVILISGFGDSGCLCCAEEYFVRTIEAWPEVNWLAIAAEVRRSDNWRAAAIAKRLKKALEQYQSER